MKPAVLVLGLIRQTCHLSTIEVWKRDSSPPAPAGKDSGTRRRSSRSLSLPARSESSDPKCSKVSIRIAWLDNHIKQMYHVNCARMCSDALSARIFLNPGAFSIQELSQSMTGPQRSA